MSFFDEDSYLSRDIAEVDPEIARVLRAELERQRDTLEMIASENFVPRLGPAVAGLGADQQVRRGLPRPRYYGGCEEVDVAEELAIERAKSLFGAEFANVQPHSGATANAAVLHAIARPGDTLLGLSLDQGGHLTHGMKINFSGPAVQHRRVRRRPGDLDHRHGRGAPPGASSTSPR